MNARILPAHASPGFWRWPGRCCCRRPPARTSRVDTIPTAGGLGPPTQVTVESGPDGVTIHIVVEGSTGGEPGSPGTDGSGTGGPDGEDLPTCQASPVNVGTTSTTWVTEELGDHPGTFPWGVSCDDGSFAIAWVPTGSGSPEIVVGTEPIPPIDPAVVRAEAFGIVGLPAIGIGANPHIGLVAMAAWFWVDGYGGGTLRGSESLGRSTVEVEITPTGYRWGLGRRVVAPHAPPGPRLPAGERHPPHL